MARPAGWFRSMWSRFFVVALVMFSAAACVEKSTSESDYVPGEPTAARTPSARAKAPSFRADAARARVARAEAKSLTRVQAELRARAALQ